MEIKVGDKVRVREDAPKIYTEGWSCDWLHAHSNVRKSEGDSAEIELDCYALVIPTKYLVKVEDKANPKFKVNDVVRTVFNETTHITSVLENGNYYLYGMGNEYPEDSLTLVEPYTEPTKQTEVKTKTKGDTLVFPVSLDLQGSYWQVYKADLAKEIVLKVANKFNAPHEAAEYAINVAKAVVEGLKRE